MFISSKDILQYMVWCNTVHALFILLKERQSKFEIQSSTSDSKRDHCSIMARGSEGPATPPVPCTGLSLSHRRLLARRLLAPSHSAVRYDRGRLPAQTRLGFPLGGLRGLSLSQWRAVRSPPPQHCPGPRLA